MWWIKNMLLNNHWRNQRGNFKKYLEMNENISTTIKNLWDATKAFHKREGRKQNVASLVAQMVKRLPAMLETWVWSLGQEDPLEKEMATHSSIVAWKIPWTEEPVRLQSMWSQRGRHNWATFTYIPNLKWNLQP